MVIDEINPGRPACVSCGGMATHTELGGEDTPRLLCDRCCTNVASSAAPTIREYKEALAEALRVANKLRRHALRIHDTPRLERMEREIERLWQMQNEVM